MQWTKHKGTGKGGTAVAEEQRLPKGTAKGQWRPEDQSAVAASSSDVKPHSGAVAGESQYNSPLDTLSLDDQGAVPDVHCRARW